MSPVNFMILKKYNSKLFDVENILQTEGLSCVGMRFWLEGGFGVSRKDRACCTCYVYERVRTQRGIFSLVNDTL